MDSSSSSSEKAVGDDPSSRPKAKPFVQAIFEMATRNDPVVGFSVDGTHLEIRDVPKLCEEILPRYFKHRSLSSLFRQLNLYGFEKVAFDGAAHAFRHDFFRRDRPDLLDQVSRSNSSRKLSRERRNAFVNRDASTSSDGGGSEGEAASTKTEVRRLETKRAPPPDALQYKLKPFVYATFEMVTNNEGPILGFSKDGNAIEIRDVTTFAAKILPRYFKHNQFSSFARQMNMYGFEKIDSRSDLAAGVPHTFFHEQFRKGRMDLLPLIVRKTKGKRAMDDDEDQAEGSSKRSAVDSSGKPAASKFNLSSIPSSQSIGTGRVKRFIESLYEMAVEGNHDEVGMSSDGTILEIGDVQGFMKNVLPMYFNHKDFAAFIRQLSVYGFVQLEKQSYRHPYFIAGRKDLLDKVVPVLASPALESPTSMHTNPMTSSNFGHLAAEGVPAMNGLNIFQSSALLQSFPFAQMQGPSAIRDLADLASLAASNPAAILAAAAAHHQQQAETLAKVLNGAAASLYAVDSHIGTANLSSSNLQSRKTSGEQAADSYPSSNAHGELPLRKISRQSLEASELPEKKTLHQLDEDLPIRKAVSGSLLSEKSSFEGALPVRKRSSQSCASETPEEAEIERSESDSDEVSSEDDSSSPTGDADEDGSTEQEASGDSTTIIRTTKSTPFVQATYEIAMLDNAAVGFNSAGSALEIRDETLFANEVLPKFFKHGNVSSFIRQLNMYSFEKTIGSVGSAHTFQHHNFRRGRQDLLALITRKQSKASSGKSGVESSEHHTKRGRRTRLGTDANKSPSHANARTKPTPFVHAVYELAMLDNDAIGWSKNGHALEIRNEAILAERYLSKYFKHRQVSSLIRQLNMYGFEKTESTPGVAHTFRNEHFERGRVDSLHLICRKHKSDKRLASDERDFEQSETTTIGEKKPQGAPETVDAAIAGLTMLRNLAQGMEASRPALDLASILSQARGSGSIFPFGALANTGPMTNTASTQAAPSSFPSLSTFPFIGMPFSLPTSTLQSNTMPAPLQSILQPHAQGVDTKPSIFGVDLLTGLANHALSAAQTTGAATGLSNPNLPPASASMATSSGNLASATTQPLASSALENKAFKPLPLLAASSSEHGSSSEATSSSGDESVSASAEPSVTVSG